VRSYRPGAATRRIGTQHFTPTTGRSMHDLTLCFVLDKSGSMQRIADDAIGGFNAFRRAQCAAAAPTRRADRAGNWRRPSPRPAASPAAPRAHPRKARWDISLTSNPPALVAHPRRVGFRARFERVRALTPPTQLVAHRPGQREHGAFVEARGTGALGARAVSRLFRTFETRAHEFGRAVHRAQHFVEFVAPSLDRRT
jgi:hypothetical protein